MRSPRRLLLLAALTASLPGLAACNDNDDASRAPSTTTVLASTTTLAPPTTLAGELDVTLKDEALQNLANTFPGLADQGLLRIGISEVDYGLNAANGPEAGSSSFNTDPTSPAKNRAEFVKRLNTPGTNESKAGDFLRNKLKEHGYGTTQDERLKDERAYVPLQPTVAAKIEGGVAYFDPATGKAEVWDGTREVSKDDIYYAFVTTDGRYIPGTLLRHDCMNPVPGVVKPLVPGEKHPSVTETPTPTTPAAPTPTVTTLQSKANQDGSSDTTPSGGAKTKPGPGNERTASSLDNGNSDVGNQIPTGATVRPAETGPLHPTSSVPSPTSCAAGQVMSAERICVTPTMPPTSGVPAPQPTYVTPSSSPSTGTSAPGSTTTVTQPPHSGAPDPASSA